MRTHQKTLMSLALAIVSGAAMATSPVAPASSTPHIDQRQANQAKRIEQGVATGKLTDAEASRLQDNQNKIAMAEDKAKADGKVTKKERRKLHHMQDHASKRIYRQKHDAQSKF
jgi:opacity protein-like surface antigen